jgi:hypothetical protein
MFSFVIGFAALMLVVWFGLNAIFYAGLEQANARQAPGNRKPRRARPRHRYIARRHARFR